MEECKKLKNLDTYMCKKNVEKNMNKINKAEDMCASMSFRKKIKKKFYLNLCTVTLSSPFSELDWSILCSDSAIIEI